MKPAAPVRTFELAAVLGLSDRRINQLAREGILPRTSRGQYPLADAVQAYIRYLGESAASGKVSDYNRERIRLTRAKAETMSDTGLTTRLCPPSQTLRMDIESLPTGIVRFNAGHNSSPTARTAS